MSLLFVEYLAGRAEIRAAKLAQIEARTRKVEDAQKVAERPADPVETPTASIAIPAGSAAQPPAAAKVAAAEPSPSRPRRSSSFFAPSQAMADTFDDDPIANAPPLMAYAAGNASSGMPLAADEPMGDAGMAELPDTVEAKPASAERAAAPVAQEAPAATGGPGNIVRSVTLRARPAKGAKAIGVVPANTRVQIIECKSWCQIQFDGKSGYIYKSFVRPS